MNEKITRREALERIAVVAGVAGLAASEADGQSPTPAITAANCRNIALTEDQAKSILNKKIDNFLDDPNVRKALKEKFDVGGGTIFFAKKLADLQVRNTINEFKQINPWDRDDNRKLPRTITWREVVERYQARLNRWTHEKLAPGYAEAMTKHKGNLPSKDLKFYQSTAEIVGYPNIQAFLGYDGTARWQDAPLYKRPMTKYDVAIKAFHPARDPFELSIEDLRSVGVSSICTIASSGGAGNNWQDAVVKPGNTPSLEL